jgi:DNA-binding MurR/RpiR family transcriptional regulator
MYATLNVNSEEKLHECVTMLRSARRIILTGIGASGLVAQNFAWKLMKIGFNAAAVRDMHALLATVQASSPDDLLLAISYTGVRRELNLAADEMLRVGGKVLAITGFTPNALQQRASHCLTDRSSLFRQQSTASWLTGIFNSWQLAAMEYKIHSRVSHIACCRHYFIARKDMNGLLRIRQRYQGLAQSDKKLADYLLLQPDTARHLSSQQLANEAGVSQSSVVKFAQKLGYKGFPALKLALSEALASQPESPSVPIHNQIRGDDPLRLVGEKLIKENTAAMYATLNVNSEEKLHECVTMLRSARRIILTGIGASGLVAQNFAWKLMKIGFNAAAVRDMHALLATVQASSPDDLLLAISYTGVRRELNLAADEMLRVGGKVLAITGFTPNALQQRASHCLYTIAEEQATNSASISACHAQGMLTDLLFIALIQQDLELAPERIRHSEALVKKLV